MRRTEPVTSPYYLPFRALQCLPTLAPPGIFLWWHVALTLHWIAGRSRHPPRGDFFFPVLAWVEVVPSLSSWSKSGRCLASPKGWPKDILPFFKYRLIPTPYEVVNLIYPKGLLTENRSISLSKGERGFITLLQYAMGFSLEEIDEHPGTAIRSMAAGAAWLAEDPRFIIWATGTDFARSALPFELGSTLKGKMAIIERLKKNPFLLSKEEARTLVESPPALTYLIYSTHKQPRLTPTNSHTVTIGVFDAIEEG